MNEHIFEVGILGKMTPFIDRIGGELCYCFLPLEPLDSLEGFVQSRPLPRIVVSMYAKLMLTISATYLKQGSVVLGQIDFSTTGKDYDELKRLIFDSLDIVVSNMTDLSGMVSIIPKCKFLDEQGYILPSLIIKNNNVAAEFWTAQDGGYGGSHLCGKLQLGVLGSSDSNKNK